MYIVLSPKHGGGGLIRLMLFTSDGVDAPASFDILPFSGLEGK